MVLERIRGLNPDLPHIAAAVTYTVLVLLAGLVAKGRATGREGVLRLLLASGIMLAPQLGNGIHVLLLQPDHVGTAVPVLLALLVLDRWPRSWFAAPLVCLMLTWVVIADRLAITIAVIPLTVVCGIWVLRDRDWYPAAFGAAAVSSAGLAALVVHELAVHGSYITLPLNAHFATRAMLPENLRLTGEGILGLYGADLAGLQPGVLWWLGVVHMIGLALAGCALFLALRRFLVWDDLIVPVLSLAIVLNIAAFAFSGLPFTIWDAHQMAFILPAGAVLAGRLLPGRLLGEGWRARVVRPALAAVLAAVLACYAAALGLGAAQPSLPAHGQDLADWLVGHHLSFGFSVYDEASITTLASGGKVRLRVLSWQPGGPVPRVYQSRDNWITPTAGYANFVVNTTVDGPPSVIPEREITEAFGAPARTYRFGPYTIMVWDRNLLDSVRGPPSAAGGQLGG